jgi:hypothetical protein
MSCNFQSISAANRIVGKELFFSNSTLSNSCRDKVLGENPGKICQEKGISWLIKDASTTISKINEFIATHLVNTLYDYSLFGVKFVLSNDVIKVCTVNGEEKIDMRDVAENSKLAIHMFDFISIYDCDGIRSRFENNPLAKSIKEIEIITDGYSSTVCLIEDHKIGQTYIDAIEIGYLVGDRDRNPENYGIIIRSNYYAYVRIDFGFAGDKSINTIQPIRLWPYVTDICYHQALTSFTSKIESKKNSLQNYEEWMDKFFFEKDGVPININIPLTYESALNRAKEIQKVSEDFLFYAIDQECSEDTIFGPVKKNDIALLEKSLQEKYYDINYVDEFGRNALFYTSLVKQIKLLLEHNIDPHIRDYKGETFLFSQTVMEQLTGNGKEIHLPMQSHVFLKLQNLGFDFNLQNSANNTALLKFIYNFCTKEIDDHFKASKMIEVLNMLENFPIFDLVLTNKNDESFYSLCKKIVMKESDQLRCENLLSLKNKNDLIITNELESNKTLTNTAEQSQFIESHQNEFDIMVNYTKVANDTDIITNNINVTNDTSIILHDASINADL